MPEPLRLSEKPPPQRRRLSSFVVSLVLHCLVAVLMAMIIRNTVVRKPMVLEFSAALESADQVDDSIAIVQPAALPVKVSPPNVVAKATAIEPEPPSPESLVQSASQAMEADPSPQIDFFGAQASGNQFVFVLDNSLSMDARDGERYQRACRELLRSVKGLRLHQSYSVFLFSWETAAMYHEANPRYRDASGDHLDDLRQWVTRASLGPGTDPRRALAQASHMHPDAVFLLTDGDFNEPDQPRRDSGWVDDEGNPYSASFDSAIEHLFADQDIPVHTIAFENPFAKGRLQEIADQTGGSYRYVKTSDHAPVDLARLQDEVKKIQQRNRQELTRIRSARNLIRDGELAMAEYLLRPVDSEKLKRTQDRDRLSEVQTILRDELGKVRLEDFTEN
ncbi:MAG: vWA domain-containing protein [Rubripirellula sp.]